MDGSQQVVPYLVSALGGCVVAIGWWIGTSLITLNQKVERVLMRLESHETKLKTMEKYCPVFDKHK